MSTSRLAFQIKPLESLERQLEKKRTEIIAGIEELRSIVLISFRRIKHLDFHCQLIVLKERISSFVRHKRNVSSIFASNFQTIACS